MNKKQARMRRARKTRARIADSGAVRLTVYRSNNNIYAQIMSADNEKVLTHASSLESVVRSQHKGNTTDVAIEVGKLIAERAQSLGIISVAFDRSGYKYHGRIKALAVAARENGLKC